jgi:hypothetical protein
MKDTRKEKKDKKKKIIYIDDGRTVSDMNVEGMPGYDKDRDKRKKDPEQLTFKEKLAVVFGAYRAYLPFLLILIGSLVLLWLFFYFVWG